MKLTKREQEIAALRLLADEYRGPALAAEFPEVTQADWPFSADAWRETRAYYLGGTSDGGTSDREREAQGKPAPENPS